MFPFVTILRECQTSRGGASKNFDWDTDIILLGAKFGKILSFLSCYKLELFSDYSKLFAIFRGQKNKCPFAFMAIIKLLTTIVIEILVIKVRLSAIICYDHQAYLFFGLDFQGFYFFG